MLNINITQLEIIKNILKQSLPQSTVWAFGSRANGTNKPFSDLDLAIENSTDLSFEQTGNLREAFQNSDLPFRIDFVDVRTMSDSFKKIIAKDLQKIA